MKLGVIARADDRGLGNQTWEVARNLNPERVLVVRVPGSERQGFGIHLDRFPGATVVTVNEADWTLPPAVVQEWLDGLDVVYSAETLYDQRIARWARNQRVATVVHANQEFHTDGHEASTWWAPTAWRRELLPTGARVVPMPVPVDRWPGPITDAPRRVLHVAGRPATGDRNGTNVVRSLGEIAGVEVVVLDQVPDSDYWAMYQGFSALLLPRRYGGLCLPAIEACGAGVIPIMPGVTPNSMWPIEPLPSTPGMRVPTPGGHIVAADVDPQAAAAVLRDLFDGDVLDRRRQVRQWAEDNSWEAMAPVWLDELAMAAEHADKGHRPHRRRQSVQVIIPWRGNGCPWRAAAYQWVKSKWEAAGYEVTEGVGDDPWIKADAITPVIQASKADIIVVADADVWADNIDEAIAEVRMNGGWAVPHFNVHRLTPEASRAVCDGGPVDWAQVEERPYRGVMGGGLVVVDRRDYLDIPMDRRFVGYGHEDQSWGIALGELLGAPWRGDVPLVHLWHPPQERPERAKGSQDNQRLHRRYLSALGRPDAMRELIEEAKAA